MRGSGHTDKSAERWTLFRFLLVGGLSSLSYSLLFALPLVYMLLAALLFALIINLTDWPVFLSSVILFCLFIPTTFQVHKRFTFLSRRIASTAFPSYAVMQLCCFSAVSAVSANLVTNVYLLDTALYLVTVGIAAMLTFLIGKYVIFRPLPDGHRHDD